MEKHKQGKSAQIVVTSIALMLITLLRCVASGSQAAGINLFSDEMKKNHIGALCDSKSIASQLIVILRNRKKPLVSAAKKRGGAYSQRQRAGPLRKVDWIFMDENTVHIAKLRAISGQSLPGQLSDCAGATRQMRYADGTYPMTGVDGGIAMLLQSILETVAPTKASQSRMTKYYGAACRATFSGLWRVVQLMTKGGRP